MIDPYDFVRLVTFALATVWSVRGLARTLRFVRRWETRLDVWGLPREWLRRCVLKTLVRTTVLDPVNLGLMLVLVGIWTLRATL